MKSGKISIFEMRISQIITISLLMSLAAYLGTAMIDSNSYAGQELELELNKRLSDAAKKFNMEFKFSGEPNRFFKIFY
jgi:hypothetical protein